METGKSGKIWKSRKERKIIKKMERRWETMKNSKTTRET